MLKMVTFSLPFISTESENPECKGIPPNFKLESSQHFAVGCCRVRVFVPLVVDDEFSVG